MLVAIEPNRNVGGITEWYRINGKVKQRRVDFNPYIVHKDPSFLQGRGLLLDGGVYNRLIEFDNWGNFYEAKKLLREREDAICYASPAKQYLSFQDYRMFQGGKFSDVKRLIFDIETTGLDPNDAKLLLVAWCTNHGEKGCIVGDEREIIRGFEKVVREQDPDILEGYNSIAFDLPFLITRAELIGTALRIGRENSVAVIGRDRSVQIGANTMHTSPIFIRGRHVVDTMIATKKYDVAPQRFVRYGLKEVARGFGVSSENRIELPRDEMERLFEEDEETVVEYAMQDVEETMRVGNIVLPAEFYQCQMVPGSLQETLLAGTGVRIDSILVSEYLKMGKGIPEAQPQEPYEGGYVEARQIGVFHNVVKADVESLYPSIMLNFDIKPESDTENIVLPMLKKLREDRLENKGLSKKISLSQEERDYHNGMQEAQKILINSVYGYMGSPLHFNDHKAASRVTEEGRKIVLSIAEELESCGFSVIEIDTDGVMFSDELLCVSQEYEESIIQQIQENVLPNGMKLAHDGRYETMVSIKKKNYVLIGYDGKTYYKGNSLKSRASEKYGLDFLKQIIAFIIAENKESIFRLYTETLVRIVRGELTEEEIRRRERITEATKISPMKKRLREVAGHLNIGDIVYVYEKEDGTLGLCNDDPFCEEYNVLYYCKKLHAFLMRLETLFSPEELKLVQKPGVRWLKNFKEYANG